MRLARCPLAVLVAMLALLMLLAVPGTALAADPVTVTGSVLRDGSPVVGVEVVVTVEGTDIIGSTATDEQGAFSLELEAAVGDELEVFATGQTSRSDPDSQGCVRTETPIGDATSVIEAIPPAPIEVDLDTVLTSTVCTATGTPRVTPPSTDGGPTAPGGGPGTGLGLVLAGLALVALGGLALRRPRATVRGRQA
jgi:hypothetical protein